MRVWRESEVVFEKVDDGWWVGGAGGDVGRYAGGEAGGAIG